MNLRRRVLHRISRRISRGIVGSLLGLLLAGQASADVAQNAIARLQRLGTPAKVASRAARHIALGLPSEATKANEKDLLLVRNGYVISYNGDRNAMNWASWQVSQGDLGQVGRNERFRPDATLPKTFYKPNSGDFKIPGFSRGHMVRSGERTANERENKKTYVFTNMLPQAINNNTGPWNDFENYYRDEVTQHGMVAHVIAGGVWGKAPVQQRGVAVPSATWKVVALMKPGQTVEQIDEHTRVVSVLMPNNNDEVKVEHNWDRYRVSVEKIEQQTGLRLFDHLSPKVADALRRTVDSVVVGPSATTRQFAAKNYGEEITRDVKHVLARGVTGTVKWYNPDKKFGFITLKDGTDVYVHASGRSTTIADGESVTLAIAEGVDGRSFAIDVVSSSPNATMKLTPQGP